MKNKVGIRTPKKDKKGNKVAQSGIRRRLKWEQEPQSGTRMKNEVGTRTPVGQEEEQSGNKNPKVGK